MAIKEQLIIEAIAETQDAQAGLAAVTKQAEKLASAESQLSEQSEQTSKAVDDTAKAAVTAAVAFGKGEQASEAFSGGLDKASSEAAKAKVEVDKTGNAAKVASEKMNEATGKSLKFSDMLKEIGNNADEAAGGLVERFGGSAAIAAIGAVAVGFAGAKIAANAFFESSERLFRSYGPEGMKVWEGFERQMFEIRGAFSAAVLGGNDLYENAKNMRDILGSAQTATELLLAPVKMLSDALRDTGEAAAEAGGTIGSLERAQFNYNISVGRVSELAENAKSGYQSIQRTLLELLGTKKELAVFDIDEQQRQIHAVIQQQERATMARQIAEGDLAAAEAEAEARKRLVGVTGRQVAEAGFDTFEEYMRGPGARYIEAAGMAARQAAVRRVQEDDKANNQIYQQSIEALQKLESDKQAIISGAKSVNVSGQSTGGSSALEGIVPTAAEAESAAKEPIEIMLEKFGEFRQTLRENMRTGLDFRDMFFEAKNAISEVKAFVSDEIIQPIIKPKIDEQALQNIDAFKESMRDLGQSASELGKQKLAQTFSTIGTALGKAAVGAGGFADAMQSLAADIASTFGDLFIKSGIGLFIMNPATGAALIAAGVALKALGGAISPGGESSAKVSSSTGADAVSASAVSSGPTQMQESYGYFEGGRSPVTIVTNDAASIRLMQNRLAFVSARGGSGV